jgi:hypothetical protein
VACQPIKKAAETDLFVEQIMTGIAAFDIARDVQHFDAD